MRRGIPFGLILVLAAAGRADDPKPKFEPTAEEAGVLAETNRERKAAGLGELHLSEPLTKFAREYAATMAKANELGHEVGGTGFGDRIKASGVPFRKAGENVAMGQRTPAAAVDAWMKSPPHKENLLNPAFTALGAGVAVAEDGTRYWSQAFTSPPEPAETTPPKRPAGP